MGKIWGRIPQIVEIGLTFSISKVDCFNRFYIISEFLIYLLPGDATPKPGGRGFSLLHQMRMESDFEDIPF